MKYIKALLSVLSCILIQSCASSTGKDNSDINPVFKDKNYKSAYWYQNSKTIVISPFKPYNKINVKGLSPGHLARDISTAKKDSLGKPIIHTAKIFRIPAHQ